MKLELEKAEIHYEQYGEGMPLIFLHGYHVDNTCLSIPVERAIEEENQFKRIYPDLPGMGKTILKERVDSTEELYGIMLQFIDTVCCGGPFAIVGYSYGGYLARTLVKHRLKQLRGLFLLCPVIIPEHSGRLLPDKRIIEKDNAFIATLAYSDREFFTSSAVLQTERVFNRMKKEILEPFQLADREMLKNLQRDAYAFDEAIDNLDIFFEGPVQFLAGRQDTVVGYEDISSIFEDYPNGELTILNGAGHNLQIEREKAFTRIFRNWMKRVLIYSA